MLIKKIAMVVALLAMLSATAAAAGDTIVNGKGVVPRHCGEACNPIDIVNLQINTATGIPGNVGTLKITQISNGMPVVLHDGTVAFIDSSQTTPTSVTFGIMIDGVKTIGVATITGPNTWTFDIPVFPDCVPFGCPPYDISGSVTGALHIQQIPK
jgi:hypothetical protein